LQGTCEHSADDEVAEHSQQPEQKPERLTLEQRLMILRKSPEQQQKFREVEERKEQLRQEVFAWEFDEHLHPMVTDGERRYVKQCLVVLRTAVESAGGLAEFVEADRQARRAALPRVQASDETKICLSPCASVRRSLEEIMKQHTRAGSEGVMVIDGYVLAMGNKKVVKIELWCDGESCEVSVCWDWDARLESLAAAQDVA